MTLNLQLSEAVSLAADLADVEALNRHEEWFRDPARSRDDNTSPFLHVVDDFYSDPAEMRAAALALPFVQYAPPLAEDVGEAEAAAYPRKFGRWLTSTYLVWHGQRIRNAFPGTRIHPAWLREKIANLLGEKIELDSWEWGGDGWNGAFHLIEGAWPNSAIHHHYKPGDVDARGWSGVIYLSPDAPPSAGTSIWRDRTTGKCVAPLGGTFRHDTDSFEQVLLVENRFNRLVLFRENVLHRGEHGFGKGETARLTQSFFFRTVRQSAVGSRR
jgi:hypothetical protein